MLCDDREQIIQSLKNFSEAAEELATCLEAGFRKQEADIAQLTSEAVHQKEVLSKVGDLLKQI